MNAFIEYEIKVAVALAVFTLFYKLMLQKDTFHRFNRIVLLVTSALAFILPFCVIVRHETISRASDYAILENGTGLETAAAAAGSGMNYTGMIESGLAAVFFLGAALMLFRIIYSIGKIRKLIAGGRHIPQEDGTTIVVVNDNDFSPVSWMKYIVMSDEDYSSANEGILIHERAHIALGHSWDILFFDLMTVLQWFNPAIWLLKADLRAIHEYEADEAVITAGTDMREYQLLLVRKAVAKVRYQAANSLNHSTLKNRIKMMSSKKSSSYGALKALYVLPLVAISLVANAETKYDYVVQEPEKKITIVKAGTEAEKSDVNVIYIVDGEVVSDINDISPDNIKSIEVLKDNSQKTNEIREKHNIQDQKTGILIISLWKEGEEKVAQTGFDGGDANKFTKWVNRQLMYPEAAKNDKKEGLVVVTFSVQPDGSVADARVLKSLHPVLDAEVVRVVSSSPKWTNNEGEKVTYALPVIFDIRSVETAGSADIQGQIKSISGCITLNEVYVISY